MEESRACEGRPATEPTEAVQHPLAAGHSGGGGAGRTATMDHNMYGYHQ